MHLGAHHDNLLLMALKTWCRSTTILHMVSRVSSGLAIHNTTFASSQAGLAGGAIRVSGSSGNVSMTACTVESSSATGLCMKAGAPDHYHGICAPAMALTAMPCDT